MTQRDYKIEDLTKAIGYEIFSLLKKEVPAFFEREHWETQVMQWCMGDDDLKVRILRFIDVFPSIKRPGQVVRHLREYFPGADMRIPKALRIGMAWTRPTIITSRAVTSTTQWLIQRIARKFIAGSTLEEVIPVLERLKVEGASATLDVLGEATTSEKEADVYMSRYIDLIKGLGTSNVSLKLSSLYSRFNPQDQEGSSSHVKQRLKEIFRAARTCGTFANIDMEQYKYRDLTTRIFRELLMEKEFYDFKDAGIVVQAYLKDSEESILDLIRWARERKTPITIRLVKGAYWDWEIINARLENWQVPVWTNKWETDAAFERLTDILLKNHDAVQTAIASHNVRSIAHAMAFAKSMGLDKMAPEFQMLYGMAEPEKKAIISLGWNLRIYTPYGELIPGIAYLVRRILENTSNESFLRQSFIRDLPEEELLKSPEEIAHLTPQAKKEVTGIKVTVPEFENEPDTDFSKDKNRTKMKEVIKRVQRQFGASYILKGAKGQFFSTNPARPSEVLATFSLAEPHHADEAIKSAEGAFLTWRNLAPEKRQRLLYRAADIMQEERFDLAAWEIFETGKTWEEADADVSEAIDYLKYYGLEAVRLGSPQFLGKRQGEVNEYSYQPRGVGLVISPWNFPLAILTGMVSASIAAGNCVILKPSMLSTLVAEKFISCLKRAGIPDGVVNLIPGEGHTVGEYMVSHPDISFIAFTGSMEAGLRINSIAANTAKGQESVKRVIAEMGGKNAIIIDEDADLDEAVVGTIHSAFGYQGQKCSAASRIIVLEDVYDRFISRLVESAKAIKIGYPEDPGTHMGPLISADAKNRVLGYIKEGKENFTLLLETNVDSIEGGGHFAGPAIFADVPHNSRMAQEEIFGPVLAVFKVKDFREAIRLLNDTRFALTGGLYSRSPVNIELAKKELQAGNFYINRKITGAKVGRQPFGGFKMSGVGSKAGGHDYLLQFVLPRTVTENTIRHGFAPI